MNIRKEQIKLLDEKIQKLKSSLNVQSIKYSDLPKVKGFKNNFVKLKLEKLLELESKNITYKRKQVTFWKNFHFPKSHVRLFITDILISFVGLIFLKKLVTVFLSAIDFI